MATIGELAARYRSGEATPTEVVEAYFRRIEALDPKVRAYLTLTQESAMAQAE
ncbi:MAG: Asp-tRNA(Asn)/Glu-tRNA(Gln) amidotransferase subunit GatA, partial [Candidatus Rokubacteria bacterium]|nr:Asp-tRNA(Asn)/Glu-tRNA(Gln) amidotransferase subunit GatA [Candidatus Rokubacteria bacterium]